jgi:hypothetical protein
MRYLAIVILAVLLVGGCSAGGTPPPRPAPSATAVPPPATTVPPPASPSGPPTVGSGGGQGGAGVPRCHTRDLSVGVAPDPAGGAAGHYGLNLLFTNRSHHACTLYGYPGVSFVAGDHGTQVNAPFNRIAGPKRTIRLAAGGRAHATIVQVRVDFYATDVCKPVQIRGYRVYPPDETAAVFVSMPQKACSARGQGVGQVLPIAAGDGAPAG